MADYISRDYTVENMENYPWDTEHDKNAAIHLVRELVPAADVVPLQKGHGRLIDADALQDEFKKFHDGKRSMLIDTAPTIVPSEGGDYNG